MTFKLVLENVSKSFGGVKANDDVSIKVRQGTVHAILGENGAGKSTLMNILYGLYQPDEGRILIDGEDARIDSPKAAVDRGVGMVHQHFMLVDNMTVTENVILGVERGPTLRRRTHARRLEELSRSFGFDVDPEERISRLPIGRQQRVEILKLVYHNADILILDEPTSVLTPTETGPFFDVLRRLRDAGKTILFITHKLDEVMAIADSVTVMRNGRVTADVATSETNPSDLARLMVGREVIFDIERAPHETGTVLLEAVGLNARDDRGVHRLKDVSFKVRAGEVLGIAGVDGNGQSELAEVITGLRRLDSGKVLVDGKDISNAGVSERAHEYGVAYVPEDRHRVGLVLDQSVANNLMLRSYNRRPFSRSGFFDGLAIRKHAERLVERFRVRLRDVDQDVRYLSGGNQQKLILARELEAQPKVLIAAQATKGLDVGAIEFVQREILERRAQGMAIVYISTELEHLMAVSDCVAVMFNGKMGDAMRVSDATPERLGLAMAGAGEAGPR